MGIFRHRAASTGLLSDSYVDEVRSRANDAIVDVIGEHVALQKRGGTFAACCPFHDDATPSFNVVPAKKFYYCHGCHENGDALKFVMEHLGLPFREAVVYLANRVGMAAPDSAMRRVAHAVPAVPPKSPPSRQSPALPPAEREQLRGLLATAFSYYRSTLTGNASPGATAWLAERGIGARTASRYGICYAPPGWNNLQSVFGPAYLSDDRLISVGLLRATDVSASKPERRYDYFRDRILFPVRDLDGAIVGAGGRVLTDSDAPKYLNSPTSPLFQKGELLYGLYEATEAIARTGFAIVVEGYMDVAGLSERGIDNAVAALGTAFRESHLDLLAQKTRNVVYIFDGDTAGQDAAWRAARQSLPLAERMNFRFVTLDGEDPDEWIRRVGAESVLATISQAPTLTRYLLDQLTKRFSHNHSPDSAKQLGDEADRLIALLPDPSPLRGYLQRQLHLLVHDSIQPPYTETAGALDLSGLSAAQKLVAAAYSQPATALRLRPALETLLGPRTDATRALLLRYNRAIELGQARSGAVPPEERAWARGTLRETPSLVRSHLQSLIEDVPDRVALPSARRMVEKA